MRSCLLVLVATVTIAEANPAAEKLFQDGRALMQENKLLEACDSFRRSQQLEPRVGTSYSLGECEEKRGNVASAWVAYVEARALAARNDDPRAATADARAAALLPSLPYLTMRAPAQRPKGFTVRRNEWEVPAAELDKKVPIDPGTFQLEASAPGYKPWRSSVTIALGQEQAIDIPALEVDPNAPAPKPDVIYVTKPPPDAALTRRYGVGLALGISNDPDVVYGLRVPIHIDTLGPGTVRALATVHFVNLDARDPYHKNYVFAGGGGAEYVWPLAPKFAVAAGLGVGIDVVRDNYATRPTDVDGWATARISPTVRIGRSLDIGLHIAAVMNDSRHVTAIGQLGVDYFFR